MPTYHTDVQPLPAHAVSLSCAIAPRLRLTDLHSKQQPRQFSPAPAAVLDRPSCKSEAQFVHRGPCEHTSESQVPASTLAVVGACVRACVRACVCMDARGGGFHFACLAPVRDQIYRKFPSTGCGRNCTCCRNASLQIIGRLSRDAIAQCIGSTLDRSLCNVLIVL